MMTRLLPAAAALMLAACSRQPAQPGSERIAILRFENLGADPTYDWMGRAFSEVIAEELGYRAISSARLQSTNQAMGARPVQAPGISSQRAAAIASGANRLGYGEYSVRDGRLDARLTIEDPAAGKVVRTIAADGSKDDLISTATVLARQLSSDAVSYPTTNARAIEPYTLALEAKDAATATALLEQAIAADPNFGRPYRALAEIKVRQKDRAGAVSLLETAVARVKSPVDKARFHADIATLSRDLAGRERALATLTKADPHDPTAWRSLAETAMARHNYGEAANAYSKALEIEPADAESWNQYGYAAALAGDLAGGMNALRRYQALRPAEANPLDSQGDINFLHGKFREAEGFYVEAQKKDPKFLNGGELFKAAMARLASGDPAGADGLAKQYIDARAAANDPLAPSRKAEWAWIAGRRRAAYGQLESAARDAEAKGQRDVASNAYATLAIWSLMLGDRPSAARMADKAVSLASPQAALGAALARFLSQPPASSPEWAARADRMFPNAPANSIKDFTLAYALLFSKQWDASAPLLSRLAASGASTPDTNLQVLLAWALIETGRFQEAEPLLRWHPIPPAGPSALLGLHFPRVYYLRALVAEKAGKKEEARNNYRLFLQLSGSDPLTWGEEKKAKAAE